MTHLLQRNNIGIYLKTIFFCSVLLLQFSRCHNKNIVSDKDTINKIDELLDSSYFYLKSDLNTSILLSKKADSLARTILYPSGLARSLRSQAYYYLFLDHPEKALEVLDESELIEIKSNNVKGLASIYNMKASLFKKLKLYDDALSFNKKVLSLQDSLISDRSKIVCLKNMANIYTRWQKSDSAIIHYHDALALAHSLKDTIGQISIYNDLGNAQSLIKNYDSARESYMQALSLSEKIKHLKFNNNIYNNLGALYFETHQDSLSLYYFNKSIANNRLQSDSLAIAETYSNIAELFEHNSEIKNKYLSLSEQVFKKLGLNEGMARVKFSKALIHNANGSYESSKSELQQASTLMQSSSDNVLKSKIFKELSSVLNKTGYHKQAFEYYEQHAILNDSILNEDKIWRIAEQEKKHLLKIKQNEISLLEKDKVIANTMAQKRQEENQKLLISLGGSVLILMLLGLFLIYFYRLRKSESRLAVQQETLLKREIQNLVDEQELNIVNATLDARKSEKEVISKELHNNIGSLLTSVKYHFQSYDQVVLTADAPTQALHTKTTHIIDSAIDEIRKLSHRFDDEAMPGFNLKNAISEFLDKVDGKKLNVRSSIYGLDYFQNTEVSIFIFRTLQELVNNAIKHSQASLLTVYLTHNGDEINIMVEDNGRGFYR